MDPRSEALVPKHTHTFSLRCSHEPGVLDLVTSLFLKMLLFITQ